MVQDFHDLNFLNSSQGQTLAHCNNYWGTVSAQTRNGHVCNKTGPSWRLQDLSMAQWPYLSQAKALSFMSVTWRSPGCFKLRSTLFKAALLIVLMARMAFVASGNSLLNVTKLEGGDSMHKEIGQAWNNAKPVLLHSCFAFLWIPPCSVLCILSRRSPPRSSSCQCHKTAGSCPDNSILVGKTMLLWHSWWEVYQKHQACSSTCHQKKATVPLPLLKHTQVSLIVNDQACRRKTCH